MHIYCWVTGVRGVHMPVAICGRPLPNKRVARSGPVHIETIPPKNPKIALKNRKKIAILPVEGTLF